MDVNFNDSNALNHESISVASSWQHEISQQVAATQTLPVLSESKSTSTQMVREIEVQTEPIDVASIQDTEGSSTGLLMFLQGVEDAVSRQLTQNLRSFAFDGYDVRASDGQRETKLLYSLVDEGLAQGQQCVSVDFNCSGGLIAAAYSRTDYQEWWEHSSVVCLWNMDRTLNHHKAMQTVELKSSATCIKFHPAHPSMLAVGLLNGDVIVVDTSVDDAMNSNILATSPFDWSHQEPVASVAWIISYNQYRKPIYSLMSTAGDGQTLIWKFSKRKSTEGSPPDSELYGPVETYKLELEKRFIMTLADVPTYHRAARSKGSTAFGVTAHSQSLDNPWDGIFASDTGSLVRCILEHPSTPDEPQSPVVFSYQPHLGPCYAISACYAVTNLFVTGSTDGTIRLYTRFQSHPLVKFEPNSGSITAISWIPMRASAFIAATERGTLLFYDLLKSTTRPLHSMVICKSCIRVLRFNAARQRYLSLGDDEGKTHVVLLGDDWTEAAPKEEARLAELAKQLS
eukprot:TRINITY_DN12556_c0_g2_i1.p2 TRINITY_DN12556_c0_g2~~TRINITY_DN12556_c0_g2_i1.p2  ORF type:complete len:513 (+),score=55.11 TRINITY_DN12556_c0_g2_i1:930-2468(+)